MPFLSRIYLNPLRTGAQNLLRNPQRMHAAVLGGLSGQPVEERVLWRLETDAHRASLLVLTQSTPSWEHLIEQAGWTAADEPQALVRPYQPVLDRAERGREFRFRLRANPVSATRNPQKPSPAQFRLLEASERPRGVRVAHRTAAHQLAWFTDRVGKWGFSIPSTTDGLPDARLGARDRMVFTKSGDTSGRRLVIQTATFEGRLRISGTRPRPDQPVGGRRGSPRVRVRRSLTLAPHPEPEMWWLSDPQDLHRVEDRLSTVYVERCHVDRDENAVVLVNSERTVRSPRRSRRHRAHRARNPRSPRRGAAARRLRHRDVLGRRARRADVRRRPRPQPRLRATHAAGLPRDPDQRTLWRRPPHVRHALPRRRRQHRNHATAPRPGRRPSQAALPRSTAKRTGVPGPAASTGPASPSPPATTSTGCCPPATPASTAICHAADRRHRRQPSSRLRPYRRRHLLRPRHR